MSNTPISAQTFSQLICPNCESTSESFAYYVTTTTVDSASGISDGRYNSHDFKAILIVYCTECFETIKMYDPEEFLKSTLVHGLKYED